MTTHADLLAAIDAGRMDVEEWDGLIQGGASVAIKHNDHLDTLRAILALHSIPVCTMPGCDTAQHYCQECGDPEPCPTVRVIAAALTRMGAL